MRRFELPPDDAPKYQLPEVNNLWIIVLVMATIFGSMILSHYTS